MIDKVSQKSMDEVLLKAILRSSTSAIKSLDEVDRLKLDQEDRLMITCNFIFDAVCTSLTNLLCHPVSKEAYQRHSVQLHVIETLRDWCRIQSDFQHCRSFTSQQRTLELLSALLEKYLTDDLLSDIDYDQLTQFASALIALLPNNPSFEPYLKKLLVRLSKSELSVDGERLLGHVIGKNTSLTLGLATLEEIYISQKQRFVEEPLLNEFQLKSVKGSKDTALNDPNTASSVDRLLEITAESPRLFLHVCHFLKNLLVYLDYAPVVLDFIKFVLNVVVNNRQKSGNDVLDLYPKHLQSLVILLRIEPSEYSVENRASTNGKLEALLSEEKDSILILLSHFPEWLASFELHITNDHDCD